MSARTRVAGLCVLGLLVIALVMAGMPRPVSQPNVVLVVIDTLRADRLGSYGHERPTSPRLDAMAAEGLRFEQVYAPSSWTLPSMTSILTGLLPPDHGVRSWLDGGPAGNIPYLPEYLRDNGYSTVALMGNANLTEGGFGRGFDLFVEARTEPKLARTGLPLYPSAEDVTDLAIEAVDRLAESRFFLLVHYMDTHSPYLLPEGGEDPFADPGYDGYIVSRLDEVRPVVGQRFTRVRPHFWSKVRDREEDRQRVRDLYDAKVRYVDQHVGRLLDHLESLALGDDTLVVVTSDHGEGLFQHGIAEHEDQPWEHQVRVPLIVRGPGVKKGTTVSEPVELIDLPLALADRAQVETPWDPPLAGGNGRLRAALTGAPRSEEAPNSVVADVVIAARQERAQMVRMGRWKLIRVDGQDRLYDLEADPGELVDETGAHLEHAVGLGLELDRRIGGAVGGVNPAEITDPELLERLRALGYVD